jgi:serine/threonine protein kinase
MGVVYKAWDTTLQRTVAIKILSRDPGEGSIGGGTDPRTQRILREARVASQIQHPNVVRIYDVLLEEESPCLVLEFVEGETLRRRMATSPVPWPEGERIAHGIARGLAAAHERHVVHGDMKPDNVILSRGEIPMITDFGLGRFFDPEGASTMTDAIKGTPAYLAPEILHGARADMRSDIYATGVLYYELLTGQRPFVAPTQAALFQAILSQPTPSVGAARPDLPARLCRVIDRMLVRDAAHRIPDARMLVAELEEADSGRLPRPLTPPPSADAPRKGQWLAGIAAVGLAGVAMLIALPRGAGKGTDPWIISGMVRDELGSPVPNALVSIDGHLFGVQTSTDGAFHGNLEDVNEKDTVLLRVSHDNYYTETRWLRVGVDSLESLPIGMRSVGSFTGRPRR